MHIEKRAGMRTTLSIDDQLLEKVREQALRDGLSLSDVINRSLRQTFLPAATRAIRPAYRVSGFGDSSANPIDLSPAEIAGMRDDGNA